MKILLDHCVDWRLSRSLPAHEVQSTKAVGWEQVTNGQLLRLAALHFDILLTSDKNIRHQQNLSKLPLPVIELNAVSMRLQSLQALSPYLHEAIERTRTHLFVAVFTDGRIEYTGNRSGPGN